MLNALLRLFGPRPRSRTPIRSAASRADRRRKGNDMNWEAIGPATVDGVRLLALACLLGGPHPVLAQGGTDPEAREALAVAAAALARRSYSRSPDLATTSGTPSAPGPSNVDGTSPEISSSEALTRRFGWHQDWLPSGYPTISTSTGPGHIAGSMSSPCSASTTSGRSSRWAGPWSSLLRATDTPTGRRRPGPDGTRLATHRHGSGLVQHHVGRPLPRPEPAGPR